MIYYEKSIVSSEIIFRVETYFNKVLSKENLEIYVIECELNKSPIKVTLKGDVDNILESELPVMKIEFKKCAEYFCSKSANILYKSENIIPQKMTPYKMLSVPFEFKRFGQKKLTVVNYKYEPSKFLIDYLVKNGYEIE